MACELWLIRHGESEWNREGRWQGQSDPALSDLGRQQSRQLAPRLSRVQFDRVYSSNLERSLETCRLALPGAEIRPEPRLREINFGCFEGRSRAELDEHEVAQLKAWLRRPFDTALPGGESMQQVADRFAEFRTELPEAGRVALFTHGGVIRCTLWTITGPPQDDLWSIQIDNAGISRVQFRPGRNLIVCVNDTAHLSG